MSNGSKDWIPGLVNITTEASSPVGNALGEVVVALTVGTMDSG